MAEGANTPPHSDEAEQAVLGAVLLDNSAFDRVHDVVSADDFYHPDHRAIWSTMAARVGANKVADVLTVFDAGGHDLAYLNSLAQGVLSAAHAREYALIVRQMRVLRDLMAIGAGLAEEARRARGDAAPALIDSVVTRLLALQQAQAQSEPVLLADLLPGFAERLAERYEGRNPAIGTGLAALDRLTAGGGRPGQLWVVGARPSMGKTALVLHLCRAVGAQRGVLMLTLEDSNESLVERHVASAGRVNLSEVRDPKRAEDSMWTAVTDAMESLRGLRVSLDDQSGITLADVRRKVQQVKRRDPGLALVIVDYLGLMEGEGDNRNQELGRIANGMKRAAKELGVWVVLLSQLNREADKRSGVPQMADLRDSGDIEGAADLIGLLHREFRRKPLEEFKHWAQLHVAKHKSGPTDILNLWFDGETQRFENWEGGPPRRGIEGV